MTIVEDCLYDYSRLVKQVKCTTCSYRGSDRAIWNNSGDTVKPYNAIGNLVDQYGY